ncbi:MAG: D-alanyl-D-alanine carboxypeptidase [Ruminococcus sp.]|nr:D-alanyl-D-alanine carboxypeptidase [Ruminococcus sp.]
MCIKKVFSFILVLVVLCASTSISPVALSEAELSAPSAILIEPNSKKILYEHNSHEQRPCASVTKVMTMLLVMEAIDNGKITYDEMVTSSARAASMGGSDIWLEEGEQMTVDDMIKATVVASANDAAVALAEHICGTEEEFVSKMNERAKQLGMNDTVFKNCNGLDEEGHVTSANDVALMSAELIKHEKIFDYTSIWMDELRGGKTQIVNTNKLLKTYNGITGLKTGTTDDAGCCMSATAERDGLSLVAVVLGCNTGTERFKDAATLLDYGFANYQFKQLATPDELPKQVEVKGGMDKNIDIECKVQSGFVLPKGSANNIEYKVSLNENIEAPVKIGDTVGEVTYTADGEKLASYQVKAISATEPISFGAIFNLLFNALISL